MSEFFSSIIFVAFLFGIMVLYFRTKNDWQNAHPKKCDMCGAEVPQVISLKDGCICHKCTEAKFRYKTIELTQIMNKFDFKKYTVAQMQNYKDTIRQRGELMASFQPTRVSQTGNIQVDDNLHLFVINDEGSKSNTFAHNLADIQSFRLVIDKDYSNQCSDNIYIDGGHIEIKIKEPINKISVNYSSKRDFIGAKHEVRKALEPDLKFLEEITGLRRI